MPRRLLAGRASIDARPILMSTGCRALQGRPLDSAVNRWTDLVNVISPSANKRTIKWRSLKADNFISNLISPCIFP